MRTSIPIEDFGKPFGEHFPKRPTFCKTCKINGYYLIAALDAVEEAFPAPPDAYHSLREQFATPPAIPHAAEGARPQARGETGDALDAARYRWLREGDNDDACLRHLPNDRGTHWLLRREQLDAAIDAARPKPAHTDVAAKLAEALRDLYNDTGSRNWQVAEKARLALASYDAAQAQREGEVQPPSDIDWERGRYPGKVTQHWLRVAFERIAAGEPEVEVLDDYGYTSQHAPAEKAPSEAQ